MNLILKKIIGFSKDDKKIIASTIDALKFCKTAIEFRIEKIDTSRDELEFFGYDYRYGICYNFENYLKDVIGIQKYNDNYSFVSDLNTDMYKSYSNYSGDRFYPIKSKDENKTNRNFYHQEDKYTSELCEIRLGLIKECKEFLEKL